MSGLTDVSGSADGHLYVVSYFIFVVRVAIILPILRVPIARITQSQLVIPVLVGVAHYRRVDTEPSATTVAAHGLILLFVLFRGLFDGCHLVVVNAPHLELVNRFQFYL